MKSPLLKESSVQDICDELSKRNLNFLFVSHYYGGRKEDQEPVISYGIRKQDIIKTIGMVEASKMYLLSELNQDIDDEFDEEDFDGEDNEEEEPPF